MAPMCNVLRTCGLIIYLVLYVCATPNNRSEPWILSVKVEEKACIENSCKYLLNVRGGEFLGHYSWRLSPQKHSKGNNCDIWIENFEIREVKTAQWESELEVIVPLHTDKVYFCLRQAERKNNRFSEQWVHQGSEFYLEPKNDQEAAGHAVKTSTSTDQNVDPPRNGNLEEATTPWADLSRDTYINHLPNARPARHETNDIEVLVNDKYVPLNELEGNYVSDDNNVASNDVVTAKDDDLVDNNALQEPQDNTLSNRIITKRDTKDVEKEETQSTHKNSCNSSDDLITSQDIIKAKLSLENAILPVRPTESHEDSLIHLHKKRSVQDQIALKTLASDEVTGHNDITSADRMLLGDIVANYDKGLNQRVKDDSNGDVIDDALSVTTNMHDEQEVDVDKESDAILVDDVTLAGEKPTSDVNYDVHKENEPFDEASLSDTELFHEIMISDDEYLHTPALIRKYRQADVTSAQVNTKSSPNKILDRTTRQVDEKPSENNLHNAETTVSDTVSDKKKKPAVKLPDDMVVVDGIRVEDSDKDPKIVEGGIPSVLAESGVTLRLFGENFTNRTMIAFTAEPQEAYNPCKFVIKGEYMVTTGSVTKKSALFVVTTPPPSPKAKLYICTKNLREDVTDPFRDNATYYHQGTAKFKTLAVHMKMLPLWVTLTLIMTCLTFSALFSGLNLGLMSLDRTELKIIANTGTEQERKYARAIMPVRDHGNYLLCSILLGNVAVNSTFTILLDELTSGLFAVIFSTLAIVLLGEITPQAICSRHGLMVGAKSIMVTKAVMAITAPLAYPVSKVLDYLLGEEIGNVYNRERLKELVKVTTGVNDLDRDEVNIISGALELRKKTVNDVMTKMEDVFMLPITSVLDFETMSEIIKSGYSRIPVFEGHRGNIVTVLFIKDLAFVDPDDNTPLRTLCQYYQNSCNFVFEDVTLDVMFKQFKEGHKGHMAFVHRINNEGEGDPFYETVGLVTLEDVIEEMIQAEIVDETDVFMDNRTKRRRNRPQNKLQDFTAFAERHENQLIHISPQLTLATFQFLSSSVEAFRPDTVSETVLRRLLKQDVIQHIKVKGKSKKDATTYVFHQGKPVDYFVLILEGRVEVTVGRENLVFEAGPFTYFGVQALTQNVGVAESPTPSAMGSLQNINMDAMLRHTFVPDYSVRAIAELYYLTVKRSLYLAAKRATLMEKGALSKGATNEQFDTEVDKHLRVSSSANVQMALISKKLLGKSGSTASTKDDFGSTSTVNKLLQSVDEDISLSGEHRTPSRQVSPNPQPVSASPHTRSSFTSRSSPEPRGEYGVRQDEQEKLLRSP